MNVNLEQIMNSPGLWLHPENRYYTGTIKSRRVGTQVSIFIISRWENALVKCLLTGFCNFLIGDYAVLLSLIYLF